MNASSLNEMRKGWNKFAVRFTETANKRMTTQCSSQLHAHLQLERASNVLEVAAGGGLGSLNVARNYLVDGKSALSSDTARTLTVTDLSPVMVGLARQILNGEDGGQFQIQCREANGQELEDVASGTMDRYISSLCLQLTPDPDAMLREARRVLTAGGLAGFTIWATPERSGYFHIDSAANKELGLEGGEEHNNYALGKDLPALRARFAAAGFSGVQIWPFQCAVELWSGEEFAKFHEESSPLGDEALRARRFDVVRRLADEWLAKGSPIGLETYIIVAKA